MSPTTPVYALPYPAAADPADVPTDMQELAERIEATQGELAYAQITANVNITATAAASAQTVVSTAAVTFEAVPILIEFYSPGVQIPAANVSTVLNLWDGSTDLGYLGAQSAGTSLQIPVNVRRRLTPTAGAHTYQIKAWVGSGTGIVFAGAGGVGFTALPAYLRITRA